MNGSIGMAVAVVATLGLAGCASMDEKTARAAPAPVPGHATIEQDDAYVAQVERIARRRGIQVQWVNVPTRRVAAQQ